MTITRMCVTGGRIQNYVAQQGELPKSLSEMPVIANRDCKTTDGLLPGVAMRPPASLPYRVLDETERKGAPGMMRIYGLHTTLYLICDHRPRRSILRNVSEVHMQ